MTDNIFNLSQTLVETKHCLHKIQISSDFNEDKTIEKCFTTTWHPKLEWINKSEIMAYVCSWEEIQEFQKRLSNFGLIFEKSYNLAYFNEYILLKTMTLIWCGNKMETGHECGTRDDILEELRRLYTIKECGIIDVNSLTCDKTWHPEGDTSSGWKYMGQQAARGFVLLQTSSERGEHLTVDLIKCVHSILMSGSMENCGEFRTTPAYADDYIFAPHDSISERMENMVNLFEKNVTSSNVYVVNVAVQLMLDFVTIHPFSNGNGRMCRMLFSYALRRMGFPFPVTLDSGHSKSYKHYITALKKAQTQGKKGPLLQLALVSINTTLMNYAAFSQSSELQRL